VNWTEGVAARVLEDLRASIELRRQQLGWLSQLPLELAVRAEMPHQGGRVTVLSARLWNTTVHVYVQRSQDAPPAIHLLRQWGGHRSPRMACVPGAWIAKLASGDYLLHRFDEARTLASLDDIGASVLSMLLGRAGKA
jgi:hypothetical protein